MFPKLINLTLLLVIQEIEYVLEDSEYPYQVAFSIQEWRNKLILDVLYQIPNYYTILEDCEELPTDAQFLYASDEERVRLETLIRQSIVDIFEENADFIKTQISGVHPNFVKLPND